MSRSLVILNVFTLLSPHNFTVFFKWILASPMNLSVWIMPLFTVLCV